MSSLPLMRHSFQERDLDGITRPMRNNVIIEKGVVLTNEYLESIRGWLEEVMNYFFFLFHLLNKNIATQIYY